MKTKPLPWRYRAMVASRSLAAIFGGYALAVALAICLARLLPLDKSEAVLAGSMASFLVYCAAAIWAFAAASAWRAWLGLLLPSLVLAALAWGHAWLS